MRKIATYCIQNLCTYIHFLLMHARLDVTTYCSLPPPYELTDATRPSQKPLYSPVTTLPFGTVEPTRRSGM